MGKVLEITVLLQIFKLYQQILPTLFIHFLNPESCWLCYQPIL